MIRLNPETKDAYKLLHDGALALSRCENHGMRVDVKYIKKQQKLLTKKIDSLESEFKATDFYKDWEKSTGKKINIYSGKQLGAFIYNVREYPVEKRTSKGNPSIDIEALQNLDIPDLAPLLKIGKYRTLKKTFLKSLEQEVVDGIVHPFFHLHFARTFRGCIAKGTKILVMRDWEKHPNGVNIEDVKKGDYVYCYDNKLNPAIREVKWSGKTGRMSLIRVHWVTKFNKRKGYLDCTPDHKIRLIDGSYVEAQNLMQDYRTKEEKAKKLPKVRTLACHRSYDQLSFTGHLKNGHGLYEHKLIFETFRRKLKKGELIHHRDHNHLNHAPNNLRAWNDKKHAKHHVKETLMTAKSREKNIRVVKRNWRKGKYVNAIKRGFDNHNSLRLTKYQLLRLLFEAGGKLTKCKYDFSTIKIYLKLYGLSHNDIILRFDKNGKYISKTRFLKLTKKYNRTEIKNILGHNFYKLKELYNLYNVSTKRTWANQGGRFEPGNHIITNIEWLNTKEDVYDLTVDEYNNFIANEICVHNSSSDPNFQNFPKRDDEQMNIIRGAIYPSKGNQLMELDYSQLEVRIAVAYHQDPTMLKYINDKSTDMHRDMAQQIFKIKKFKKDDKSHSYIRSATKNAFVFPAFYGDYHVGFANSFASSKWMRLPKNRKWKPTDGVAYKNKTIAHHLIKHDIDHLGLPKYEKGSKVSNPTGFTKHLQDIENHFWNKRFPVYNEWKEDWYQAYLKNGYFYNKTGFTFQGVMNKKDAINYPVQSSAFHVLLWSLIEGVKAMLNDGWKTRFIGQIHDAIVFDVYPPERDHIIDVMKLIMTLDVLKRFPWINVPLEIECELCPIDASWNKKEKFNIN